MNQLVFLLLQSSVDWCLNFSLPFVTIKFKFLRLHLFFKYTKNKLVLIEFFFGVPHLATYIIFLFNHSMNQDWVHELILAWLWHHFHLVLDEIWTHNLPIVSRVCYPLDQTFAQLVLIVLDQILKNNQAEMCICRDIKNFNVSVMHFLTWYLDTKIPFFHRKILNLAFFRSNFHFFFSYNL